MYILIFDSIDIHTIMTVKQLYLVDAVIKIAFLLLSAESSELILSMQLHYSDVIMGVMVFQSPASRLYAQFKENIKASRHWPLWGESTRHRWIPLTKGQRRGKCFHLMTSSWHCSLRGAITGSKGITRISVVRHKYVIGPLWVELYLLHINNGENVSMSCHSRVNLLWCQYQ